MKTKLPALALTLAVAGYACDIPTEPPEWETTWVVPAESTTISVSSLLPDSVRLTANGQAFVLDLPGTAFSRSLGEMCGSACAAFEGLTVPKPAFTASLSDSIALPGDVASAALTGGGVAILIRNELNFDPLRPGGSSFGSLAIEVSSGGQVIASQTLQGETTALPANGGTLQRTLALQPATVSGPISVVLRLTSPAGGSTRIENADRLTVAATPQGVQLSEARVKVAGRRIESEAVVLDLGDVDATVIDQVRGGGLRLEIQNPFEMRGDLSLRITAPGVAIVKAVTINPGANKVPLTLTEAELKSILGRDGVRLEFGGGVTALGSTVAVTPTKEVAIKANLELTISVVGG